MTLERCWFTECEAGNSPAARTQEAALDGPLASREQRFEGLVDHTATSDSELACSNFYDGGKLLHLDDSSIFQQKILKLKSITLSLFSPRTIF